MRKRTLRLFHLNLSYFFPFVLCFYSSPTKLTSFPRLPVAVAALADKKNKIQLKYWKDVSGLAAVTSGVTNCTELAWILFCFFHVCVCVCYSHVDNACSAVLSKLACFWSGTLSRHETGELLSDRFCFLLFFFVVVFTALKFRCTLSSRRT